MNNPHTTREGPARRTPDVPSATAHDHNRVQSSLRNRAPRRLTLRGVAEWMGRIRRSLNTAHTQSMGALVAAVDAKDPYTRVHSLAVAAYSASVARRMGLPGREVETIRSAALLHDVGKIGIPDAILAKPGPLTDEEFEIIKRHPDLALDILGHVRALRSERPIILHHHERYDGKGYPEGLSGDRIPLGARIVAVTDALDTMLSARSYKKPYSIDRIRAELHANAGRQFDPEVVEVTLRWMEDWAIQRPQPGP